MIAALLIGSALAFPATAMAQSIAWDGDAGIDWASPTNWSGNALPGNADTVTIDVAPSAVQPSVLTPQTVARTDIVRGTLTVSSTLTSAEVRLPNFLSAARDPNLDSLQGHLVVTAGGSIVGTVRVGGFEFSGVATRIEGPVTLSPASGIEVTGGGVAEFTTISLGNGGVDRSGFVTVSGAGSRLSADAFSVDGAIHTITVSAGGALSTNQGSLNRGTATITGPGSVWNIAATSNNNTNLGLTPGFTLSVLDGGRINSLNPFSMQIGGTSNVRIAGAGSAIELASGINIGGTNASQTAGSFVIEDGGSLIVHGANGSSLGYSQRGEVIIRNGGSWIQDGGVNAGVQINSANLLIDGGAFSAGGIVAFDQTSDSILRLRNANFTARALDAARLVEIGASSGSPAAAAGTFDVGMVLLRSGKQIILNHTEQNYVIASEISGDPGALISNLAGVTNFTGPNGSYAGDVSIAGGSVRFNGSFGSAGARATLNSEGGLGSVGGSGTFGGTLVVTNGTVAPGNSPGTLTIGQDLLLSSNAVLDFELGAPDLAPGNGSDLIVVGRDLTLDGTLNVTDVGGFGAGLYRLINYTGTLTDNGLAIGAAPAGYDASNLTVQTSVANAVNLVVGGAITPPPVTPVVTNFGFWDGANTAANGAVDGGAGTWTATATNWTLADGSVNGAADPAELLIFAGTGGAVAVDTGAGAVRASTGMQFASNGYALTDGQITLDGSSGTIRVGDGTAAGAGISATIGSVLAGPAAVEKTDLGTLVLSGANTYAGGTRILGGTVEVAADAALGASAGAVTLDGGTLRTTASLSSARAVTIGAGGGTLDSGATALTLSGAIGGTGALTLAGSGTRSFTGNSSAFAGATTLAAGSLALAGSLGGQLTVAAPATLTGTGRAGGLVLAGTISPGASAGATGTFNVTGNLVVRAGSTLRIDLAASGASDRIEVGGTATLQGGTVVLTTLDPDASYAEGATFRIVNAAGGLSGTFAGISESSAFLDFTLGYDPTGAFVTTRVIARFPAVAQTRNQTEAATALVDLTRTSGSDSLAVFNALLPLGADAARAAFDATSGEIYPTVLANRQRAALALVDRITAHSRSGGPDGLALWGGLVGDRGHVAADGNGARSDSNAAGGETGLDYRGAKGRWAIGLGGGWQKGWVNLDARASRARTDAWHLGGYARYGSGGTGFSAVGTLVYSSVGAGVSRTIGFGTLSRQASAHVDLSSIAASSEVRFGFGHDALAIGPTASVAIAATRLGSFAETGAGALNLSSSGKRDSWARYGVGGFARHASAAGVFDLAVRYVHRDGDEPGVAMNMAGSPTALTVRPALGSQSGVRADASATFALGGGWSVSGALGASTGHDEGRFDGSARFSYRF